MEVAPTESSPNCERLRGSPAVFRARDTFLLCGFTDGATPLAPSTFWNLGELEKQVGLGQAGGPTAQAPRVRARAAPLSRRPACPAAGVRLALLG